MSEAHDSTSRMSDRTHRLWSAFRRLADEAARQGPASTPAPLRRPVLSTASLLSEVELTRLWELPLERALKRVLAEIQLEMDRVARAPFPNARHLAEVAVIRSGGMHLFDRWLQDVVGRQPRVRVHVICHQQDVESIRRRWPDVDLRWGLYPSFERFDSAVLRQVIDTHVPRPVTRLFFLDNDPRGAGADLGHVAAAIPPRFRRVWVYNGAGDLFNWRSSGLRKGPATLSRDLLGWYAARSELAP